MTSPLDIDITFEAILDNLDYASLFELSLTNKTMTRRVDAYLDTQIRKTRNKFNMPEISDNTLVEIIYHLNNDNKWSLHGITLDRDGDGELTFKKNNNQVIISPRSIEWKSNDKLHRVYGPAKVELFDNGGRAMEGYYRKGKRHSDHGPALITWRYNGKKSGETYYHNGKLHRDDSRGPALIRWDINGRKIEESYYSNGKFHRNTNQGPASVRWYSNGNKADESYYHNGKRHRDVTQGPAWILYYTNGDKKQEIYYLNGDRTSQNSDF